MFEPNHAIEAAIVSRFLTFQSGVICDALGRLELAGWMSGIRPVRPKSNLAGRARTLSFGRKRGTPPADVNMYAAIRACSPGDVLVIGTERCEGWIYGENVAHHAQYQGLAGIVTDAAARDGAELSELSIACFARGLETRPPFDIEIIAADVPIDCGGAQVRPGDLVCGDTDGIVVVPCNRIEDVLRQAEDLNFLEKAQEDAIARKAPLPEIYEILKKKKTPK
jgi:4-hydroxy-4-methyl-2-oxoglutarate aldolase